MIIDFHTHIFSPRVRERRDDYLKKDPTFAELYSSPRARIATAEELVASMDQAGVDVSLVLNLGWASQELCREGNDYLLEAAQRFPGRLVPACAVQPRAGEEALREMERCARAGARAVGELRPDLQGFSLDDSLAPLVAEAKSLGLLLVFHTTEPVGHAYAGKGQVAPDCLYQMIVRFPEARLVLAHWGGGLPFYALMPEVARALANTYFDTAASPFLYQRQVYRIVAALVGPERILFGSDYPLLGQGRVLEEVRASGLSPEARDEVLGLNAKELLGLG